MQANQSYYAYFRFYTPDDSIAEVLQKYAQDNWSVYTPSGYNYKEYHLFTDNAGGLSKGVSALNGYIKTERETGFIDGAPTDYVYDANLLMGSDKIVTSHAEMLHCLKPPVDLTVRKLNSSAVADGKVDIDFGESHRLEHAFYIVYDEAKIERYVYSAAIQDTSTDDYSLTVDLGESGLAKLTVDTETAASGGTNALTDSETTYATLTNQRPTSYIIYDIGAISHIFNVVMLAENTSGAVDSTWYVQGSTDKAAWTTIVSQGFIHNTPATWIDAYADRDCHYRYIKIVTADNTNVAGHLHILKVGLQ